MKSQKSLFLILLPLSTFAQENNNPPIVANIYTNVNVTTDAKNTNESSVQVSQKTQSNFWHNIKTSIPSFDQLRSSLNDYQQKSTAWLSLNRWKVAGFTALGIYTTLCYKLWRGKRYLQKPTLWSSWHKLHSMESLLAQPHQELAQALLHEIQRRYTTADNPADFIRPFVAFIRDVEVEMKHLEKLRTLNFWTYRLVVPFNLDEYANLGERIQRLTYFNNLFSSWIADYKIAHNRNKLNAQLLEQKWRERWYSTIRHSVHESDFKKIIQ